jgi:hypothetical protein
MFSINTNPICLTDVPGFSDLLYNDPPLDSTVLKVNHLVSKTTNQKYKLIRYDKDLLTSDLVPSYGLFRSVIVNANGNVVCFSPPKSISAEEFVRKYSYKKDTILAMEFVEGTMINLFWDACADCWELSTRNTVGACSSFYKNENLVTFRDMFWEAAKETNLDLNLLNKEFCYSFVLQHPKNRIVVPFKKAQLYLVACYTILHGEHGTINVHPHSLVDMKNYDWSSTSIRFPAIYDDAPGYSELIQKYASMNTPYDVLGVVFYNTYTGERTKIRNPVYEQVRSLRGNQPRLQYQYLCLRKEGRVAEYLKYYPESKRELSDYRDQVHLFTNTLYSNYVSCYIKKDKPLLQFSEQYRTHMFHLHQIYRNDLMDKKLFITSAKVIQYVNELHPSLLMHCLNFPFKKRNVDLITAEDNV